MENVEKTIDSLCEWITSELKNAGHYSEGSILPEMVSSLAELITAHES